MFGGFSKQQQVFAGFYLRLVSSGPRSSALPSWCQEGLRLQEPCSGVSEQWGQQEGIILAGIAIKGTFYVTLSPQSDSVQVRLQGSTGISSSAATTSSHVFL